MAADGFQRRWGMPVLAIVVAVFGLSVESSARDPASDDGSRGTPPQRGRFYQQVERDVDRGTGRVEDPATYELRQLEIDRLPLRPGVEGRRTLRGLDEDQDRKRRLERQAPPTTRPAGVPPASAVVIPARPAPFGSPLSGYVEEESQRLTRLRETYQTDLRAAERDRDDAIAKAKDGPAKSLADRRFAEQRAKLTRQYQLDHRSVLNSD